jgi:hypothetical protein
VEELAVEGEVREREEGEGIQKMTQNALLNIILLKKQQTETK